MGAQPMMHPEYFRFALLYLLLEEIKALPRNIFMISKKKEEEGFLAQLGEFREFLHPLKFAEYIFQTTLRNFSLARIYTLNNSHASQRTLFYTHLNCFQTPQNFASSGHQAKNDRG